MKTGKSIVDLAKELERIKETARDFIVPTEKLRAEVSPQSGRVALAFTNGATHSFGMTPWASGQVAGYSDIPKAYFDRIATENPKLLADNINHGLEKIATLSRKQGKPESRLVRSLDGNVRGMLSSRYRILDSHDMLETVFPVLANRGMGIISSEITDKRLFLKATTDRLSGEVKKGDVVQYGLVVSTSDVGAGSVRVEPMIFRLACLNGMISSTAIRKFHIGKDQAEGDIREIISDKTRELSDHAFWMTVRDVVLASLRPEIFQQEVDKLRVAANEPILNFDLPRVVELTMKATGIVGEGKKNSILAALANGNQGAGLTRYGLINSFTAAAHDDAISYEESVELERAGGQILELPKSQWSHIAAVA